MIRTRRSTTLLLLGFVGGCGGVRPAIEAPAPERLPELEELVAVDSTDLGSVLLLAMGYRSAHRTPEALALVQGARAHIPQEPTLALLVGLFSEETEDFTGAREAFEEFLSSDPPKSLREEAEAHLQLVRLEELKADVRGALAREAELADAPPDPRAVGVFPFRYEGGEPDWAPLSNALAELLITDLGITGRLTVLERVKVRALLDEMALAEAGLVDQGTAARSGRILGAGHLVQGSFRIGGTQRIGVDAAMVRVEESGETGLEPIQEEGEIGQLFDLEKEIALGLHAQLGVQLTPEERARISERQTENVHALLAFGRGLLAADAGDFQAAQAHYAEAAQLDPNFSLAQARLGSAARMAAVQAVQASMQLQAFAQRLALQRAAVLALQNAPASIRRLILTRLTIQQRAVMAEILGEDRVGAPNYVEMIFPRPGGGE